MRDSSIRLIFGLLWVAFVVASVDDPNQMNLFDDDDGIQWNIDETDSSLEDPLFDVVNINNSNNEATLAALTDEIFLDKLNWDLVTVADDQSSPSSDCSPALSSSSPLSRSRLRGRETDGGFCVRKDGTGIDFRSAEEVRKYWCSETGVAGFLNIPICRAYSPDFPEFELEVGVTGIVNLENCYGSTFWFIKEILFRCCCFLFFSSDLKPQALL